MSLMWFLHFLIAFANPAIYQWPKGIDSQQPNSFYMASLHKTPHHGMIVLSESYDLETFENAVRETFFPKIDLTTDYAKYRVTFGRDRYKVYASQAVIVAKLDFAHAKFYQWFQQISAQLIPNEYRRPTVQLSLTDAIAPLFTAGILGGVGPLADADVVMRLLHIMEEHHEIDKNLVQIKVLSDPPPRSAGDAIIDTSGMMTDIVASLVKWDVGKKNSQYTIRVRNFLHDPTVEIFEITSNTAHRNLAHNTRGPAIDLDLTSIQINEPSQPERLAFAPVDPNYINPFTPGTREFINVVSTTTKLIYQIAKTDPNIGGRIRALIVGTDQAWEDKLYQKAFDSLDIEYVDLNEIPSICHYNDGTFILWEKWLRKAAEGSHIYARVKEMVDEYKDTKKYIDAIGGKTPKKQREIAALKRKYNSHADVLKKYEAIEAGIQVIKESASDEDRLFGARIILDVMKEHIAEVDIVAYTCSEVTIGVTPHLYLEMVKAGRSDKKVPKTVDTTQLMALNIAEYLLMRIRVKEQYLRWDATQYAADTEPINVLEDQDESEQLSYDPLPFRAHTETIRGVFDKYDAMELYLALVLFCFLLLFVWIMGNVSGCICSKILWDFDK